MPRKGGTKQGAVPSGGRTSWSMTPLRCHSVRVHPTSRGPGFSAGGTDPTRWVTALELVQVGVQVCVGAGLGQLVAADAACANWICQRTTGSTKSSSLHPKHLGKPRRRWERLLAKLASLERLGKPALTLQSGQQWAGRQRGRGVSLWPRLVS